MKSSPDPVQKSQVRCGLPCFGSFLREARNKVGLSQKEAARQLTMAGHAISQNAVAQLELGRVTNLDDCALKTLADVYRKAPLEVLAALVREKYPSIVTEGTADLIRRGGFTVREVLHQIRTLPDLSKVAIIVPNFIDNEDSEVFEATAFAIKERGVHYVYFVPGRELEEKVHENGGWRTGRFFHLTQALTGAVGRDLVKRCVRGFPIEKLNAPMITLVNDFVILDAMGRRIGYEYFREGDKPNLAVELAQDQLETLFKVKGLSAALSDRAA
jgi:transcriptional regulator with XRE-family HTH domain